MSTFALSTSQQIAKWVIVVVGLLFVVALVGGLVYRMLRGARSGLRGRRITKRIRTNMEYDLEAAAADDVLELGERIDASRMSSTQDHLRWQAALDCYEAAAYAHDHARGPADHLGAVVLAMLGQDNLDSAVDGAAYDDQPVCYFDPRHGRRYGDALGPDGGPRTVSACRTCCRAAKGARSAFAVDGAPYYRSGVEPWASTGYGSVGDLRVAFVRHRW